MTERRCVCVPAEVRSYLESRRRDALPAEGEAEVLPVTPAQRCTDSLQVGHAAEPPVPLQDWYTIGRRGLNHHLMMHYDCA